MPLSIHLLKDFPEDDEFPIEEKRRLRNLFSAILGKAIHDAFTTAQDSQHYVKSARYWLFGPQNTEASFSFAWICEQLDLDYRALQTTLKSFDSDSVLRDERMEFLLA